MSTAGHFWIRELISHPTIGTRVIVRLTENRFSTRIEVAVNMPSLQDGGISYIVYYKHIVPSGTDGSYCLAPF